MAAMQQFGRRSPASSSTACPAGQRRCKNWLPMLVSAMGMRPDKAALSSSLDRRVPLAIPMNERLLIDVAFPKPTVSLSASYCRLA
jgi:hypothetical protein